MLARFEEQESEKQERLRRMRYESHVKQEEAIDQQLYTMRNLRRKSAKSLNRTADRLCQQEKMKQ